MAALDKDQSGLWKAMAAFENGVFFLGFEQYGSAENCFIAVTREFPKCPEAWANLGAARLMRYCDGLTADDLRGRGIGQPAVAAFYRRPASLEAAVRGADEQKWKEAVQALRKAVALDSSLALPRANLGLAFLLDPSGPQAEEAVKQFHEATRHDADSNIPPEMRIAMAVNAGVAERVAGHNAEAIKQFDEAQALFARPEKRASGSPATGSIAFALLYNRAFQLAESPQKTEREDAAARLEGYLGYVEPSSPWWQLGLERYQSLCKDLGRPAKPRETLIGEDRQSEYRLTTAVHFGKELINLGEAVTDVTARIGEGEPLPIARGTDLARRKYPPLGAELLTSDRVLAIFLAGSSAPPLKLRRPHLGGGEVTLRVGMPAAELDKAFEGQESMDVAVDRTYQEYRYYPDTGVGARMLGHKVEELVVTQMPRR
jgi:hypothetical protein